MYDKVFNSGTFLEARKQVFEEVPFQEGSRILFVGVGTGADLAFIDTAALHITAIDYSKDMLEQAKYKFGDSAITFMEMDAQHLQFSDGTFDYIVASLILSVVPDANQCLQEMERVLKKHGQIVIFDKFVPKDKKLSAGKKLLRPMISLLGTDIGLRFEELIRSYEKSLTVTEDQPVMLKGMYRKIVLAKE